jgi:hypothetical protein
MKVFFTILFFINSGYAAGLMPRCVRPKDFSMGKFVATYEACLGRQSKFCNTHKESKECASLLQRPAHPYFKVTVDDIDPTKRCKILRDGSYRCLQDPVRLITPTQTPAGAPQVASTPSTVNVPLEDGSGNSADPSATPAAFPSAGPGPLLHPPKR